MANSERKSRRRGPICCQPLRHQSSPNFASISARMAVIASSASGPSATMRISLPRLAASIISPMMDRASTVCPSLVTVMCEENRAAASTSLAEARACRPFLLMIFAVASRRNGASTSRPAHEIRGTRAHIFAARVDRFLNGLVEPVLVAHVHELDEAGQVGAREHLDLAALEEGEREIARRAAIHVGHDNHTFAEIDGFHRRRDLALAPFDVVFGPDAHGAQMCLRTDHVLHCRNDFLRQTAVRD